MFISREKSSLVMTPFRKDEPMKLHTTYRIGGNAGLFLMPRTEGELLESVKQYPHALIVGGGSNLLISDSGVPVVISTLGLKGVFSGPAPNEDTHVTAAAGHNFTSLSRFAQKNGLAGLEFAFGIPGTVGGAVLMNAGAFGGEVKDNLESARLLVNGEIVTVEAKDLGFSYRASHLPKGAVILSATFRLKRGEKREILNRMKECLSARKRTQPLTFHSAGSVFKNPSGMFAGKIIEGLGLKGYREGDAQVSEKHANFIVNLGCATAQQVFEVIRKVEETAMQSGIKLEPEIKFAGSFN
jgi:UDP-N-acetylmuramate dehydrogenase